MATTVFVSVMTASGHRLTVLPKSVTGVATTTVTTVNRMIPSCQTTTSTSVARPVMRVPPLNMSLGSPSTLGPLINTVVAGTTTVTTTTTVTSTKTSTAVTQPVLAAIVQQSQRNNSLRVTSPSVSSNIMTRNETKIAEEKKQKQEMQAEAQSVFYLVSIVWGGCLEVSKIVGLQVYGYKQKLVLVLQSLQCEGFKGWQ